MVNISTCNARSPPVMASIYFIPWVKEVWLEEVTFFNRWYKRGVPFCQKWDKKKMGGWTPWCGSRTTLPSQELSFMNDSTGAVKFNPREAWKIIRDSREEKAPFVDGRKSFLSLLGIKQRSGRHTIISAKYHRYIAYVVADFPMGGSVSLLSEVHSGSPSAVSVASLNMETGKSSLSQT